jgi:hypothetical protein
MLRPEHDENCSKINALTQDCCSLGTRVLAHTPAQTKHPEPVPLANRGEGTLDTVEARRIKRLGAKLLDAERRLVVSPRLAEEMLPMSHKQLYGLLNNGELESFTVGRRRKITVASIKQFIAARLVATSTHSPASFGRKI